jgi:two-component system, NarL family, sensor kinase
LYEVSVVLCFDLTLKAYVLAFDLKGRYVLKLTSMRGNYIIDQESVNNLDRALDMLDDSIRELRSVSYNMIPELLLEFGLKDALQEFCDQLSKNKYLKISFNFSGTHSRLESSLENALYSMATELADIAFTHADATEVLIQVIQEDNHIHLSVKNNGKGFDLSGINSLRSSGLQNIYNRVEVLKGLMQIDSQTGKATEIKIEFDIAG